MADQVRTPSFCVQCRSRCGCTAVTENGVLVAIEPAPEHPTGVKLCPKGQASPELVYHPDRLTTPLRRTSPKGAQPQWEKITWSEALDAIAAKLGDIKSNFGAEHVAFSVTTPSGTQISDGIAWIERFIRCYGSPNTIYGTEICNWHKDFASRFTYGTDIGTPDFANTDCILLWGNNPAATWLARSVEIQKAIKRGAKLIVVDPKPTLYARRANNWLRVRPGTDQALALGLAHILIARGTFDVSFIRDWSNGPFLVRSDTGDFLRDSDLVDGGRTTVFLAAVKGQSQFLRFDTETGCWLDDPAGIDLMAEGQTDGLGGAIAYRSAFSHYAAAAAAYPPKRVSELTGIAVDDLYRAADTLSASRSVAYYAWNGVGQSVTATQTDRAISLLYSLTGSYGAAGGNVPGGAAAFADISGMDLLPDAQRQKALGIDLRPLGPPRSGWVTARDVYKAILTKTPYPIRMLFSFGTNLLVSQPDTAQAREALKHLDFHVHADLFLNASAQYADIVLPVSSSWEHEGLRTGFDCSLEGLRQVQLRPAAVAPVGDARSDTEIVLALASRLGMNDQFFGGSVDRGHDHMLAATGLTVAELRTQPKGVILPGTVTLRPYAEHDASGRAKGFPTPSRRLEVYSEVLQRHGQAPVPILDDNDLPRHDPDRPLRLGCAKTIIYCHSQHRNLPSLRRLLPDPLLEMSVEAAATRGIAANDWVEVTTVAGSFVARCKISKDLAADSVFAQHGWWVEGAPNTPYAHADDLRANMNSAVDTTLSDPISGSIPLRATSCEVRRLPQGPAL